jgi:hypothetical protein
MEPKEREEVHRSLQFGNKPSQETDKDLGRMTEKTLSGKRLADPGQQPSTASRKRRPGKPRSGSDSNASNSTRGH